MEISTNSYVTHEGTIYQIIGIYVNETYILRPIIKGEDIIRPKVEVRPLWVQVGDRILGMHAPLGEVRKLQIGTVLNLAGSHKIQPPMNKLDVYYSALVDFPNGGSRVYKLEELMNKLIADGL